MNKLSLFFFIIFIFLIINCQFENSVNVNQNLVKEGKAFSIIEKIASFENPKGLVLNNTNLYITDGSAIYKINTVTKKKSLYAGKLNSKGYLNGVSTSARFYNNTSVTVDSQQNVYVLDNKAIRKIDKNTNVTTLFFHNKTTIDWFVLTNTSSFSNVITNNFNSVFTNYFTNSFILKTSDIFAIDEVSKEERLFEKTNIVVVTNIVTNFVKANGNYDVVIAASTVNSNLIITNEDVSSDGDTAISVGAFENIIISTNIFFTNFFFYSNINDINIVSFNDNKNIFFLSLEKKIFKMELEKDIYEDKGINFFLVKGFKEINTARMTVDRNNFSIYLYGSTKKLDIIPFINDDWSINNQKSVNLFTTPKGGVTFLQDKFYYTDAYNNIIYRMNLKTFYNDLVNVLTVEENTNVAASFYLDTNRDIDPKKINGDNFFFKIGSEMIRDPKQLIIINKKDSKIIYFLDKNSLYKLTL